MSGSPSWRRGGRKRRRTRRGREEEVDPARPHLNPLLVTPAPRRRKSPMPAVIASLSSSAAGPLCRLLSKSMYFSKDANAASRRGTDHAKH